MRRRDGSLFWLLFGLLVPWTRPASAQAPSPASPGAAADEATAAGTPTSSTITPPVVKKNEGVAYPAQALKEGFRETVVAAVLVDVDAAGTVTHAVMEHADGQGVGHGIDEAAVAAATKLEFTPALRGGKPVAARLRFVFTFTPPPAAISGRVLGLSGDHPVGGALVTVGDAAGKETAVTTGADGGWRVDGLAAGSYHVTIQAPGRAPHEADESVQLGEEVHSVDRLAAAQPLLAAGTEVEGVQEVEVRGERPPREVTKRTLDQSEISRIPGTNGDALRSLQNLPGVGRPPGFAGLLIVRGSAPQDSQIFVDGTPVPIVYHFGGLSSVVPTHMLNRLDFYPGNFSTQYGRAMGGIVEIGLLSPSKDRVHGQVAVDFLDSRVLAQGPIFDSGWRFAVAGRRSYVDLWLGPLLKALNNGVSVSPVYYDYQAILERDFGSRASLRFAFFGSSDSIAILNTNTSSSEPELGGSLNFQTDFWRAQAIYRNRFSADTELKIVGAFGKDAIAFKAGNLFFNLDTYPITSRVEVSQKLATTLTMNVGLDLLEAPYTVSARIPPLPKPGEPPAGPFSAEAPRTTSVSASVSTPAMYVEWEATPWRGARIVPGVRLDYTHDTATWDVDPRVVVRQDVTTAPRTTLKGGVGLFSQPPQPQDTNAVFGTPGLTDNRAIHYDLGVEREFTRNIEASFEGFYKQLDHLVTPGIGSTGSGVAYGAETLIRYKPDAHFFGWLAYTLSRSLRRDAPGMPLLLSQYDETHILTVLGRYRLGRGWEFGARYRLTSGYMYTPATYGFYDENIGTYLAQQAYPAFGSRLPLFQSIDLRVDKTWKFTWGEIGAYLDVLNSFNSGNVAGISYNFNSTRTSYAGDLPFLPSLGIRVEL